MAISTDSTVQDLKNKINFKNEEISFFASKIIVADNTSGDNKKVIASIDSSIMQDLDQVNSTLRDLKTAYQARVDEGCKSDLFWRVTAVETITSSTGLFDSYKYTLKCTKLKTTYEKIYFGRTEPYTTYEKNISKTLNIPLPPLDDGSTVYYVSDSTTGMVIGSGYATVGIGTSTSLPATPGLSSFSMNSSPPFGLLSDNLYGLKYYDQPYSQDIGDTYVCSFPGKISVGSTFLYAISDASASGTDQLEVGQIITSSKDGVFSIGYNTVVGIATTPGNTDPNKVASPASATAGINTSYQLSVISITNGGTGFTTTPSVTISAPNAITAIGTPVVSSSGSITSVTITNPGTGYTQAPLVYFSAPGSRSAAGIGSTGALGIVTSVSLTNTGYGYTLAPSITFANPPAIGVGIGSTARGVAFISTSAGGIVTGVAVTFPGFGYTTSPGITFTNPGIYTAVGIATLGVGASVGIVTGIIIGTGLTNTGFGYTSSTPISVTIGDPTKIQALATANVSSASTISSITLSDVGAGYTYAPTVTIDNPALQVLTIVTLQNPAIGDASYPESDGSTVSFTASISAIDVAKLLADPEKLSVKFSKGTFSPETVGIMTSAKVGIGVSVKYDNSGYSSGSQSWKPERAFPKVEIKGGKDIPAVEEPKVGAGKIYYTDGLNYYPITNPSNPNTSKASEGDTIQVIISPSGQNPFSPYTSYTSLASFIAPCPSCSSTVNTLVTNSTTAANTAKTNISSGIGTINSKIDAANQFRKLRNDNQLAIWGYRTMLGQLIDEKKKYENILNLFGSSAITDIFK